MKLQRIALRSARVCLAVVFSPLFLILAARPAHGQTVIATIPTSGAPVALAVNPVTNKIYVATRGSTFPFNPPGVTVIDGVGNSTTTLSAQVGVPFAVAVNAVTNKIYVLNSADVVSSLPVWVIDGATNTITTVTDPNALNPNGVAVNPVTNKIYVANDGDVVVGGTRPGNVTVIDGATNSIFTVTDPNAADSLPRTLAVNPVTNKIYVVNGSGSGNVTVIDGATNATTTVSDPTPGGPRAVAVNPVTNKIYVTHELGNIAGGGAVTVIDGATNSTTTVTDPNARNPFAVAVNPVTNKIYVANLGNAKDGGPNNGNVTVIDGATNATTTVADPNAVQPIAVAVDSVTNKIYVANGPNSGNGNLTVIDGATNSTTTLTDPSAITPLALAVNTVTNKIYVANFYSNNVTVIDGAGAGTPVVRLSPPSLTFASQTVGTKSASQKVTLTNSGNAPLQVKDIIDVNQADFAVVEGCGPDGASLAPGASCPIWISFTPTQDGTPLGTVKFIDNAANSPQIVSLKGTGIGTSAIAEFEPSNPISFAPQKVGTTSAAKTVLLINPGNATLSLASIATSGDFAQTNSCPASLAPAASCKILITFTPAATGTRAGALTLTDNAAASPQVLKLSGTGN